MIEKILRHLGLPVDPPTPAPVANPHTYPNVDLDLDANKEPDNRYQHRDLHLNTDHYSDRVAYCPPPISCADDCNGDQHLTVDELLTLVNIALGNAQASACPHRIPSGGAVDIALIIQAVNDALTACPGS